MKSKPEYVSVLPSSLILHKLHPAYSLHPDVRDRLTNGFNDNGKKSSRRFSKQSLIHLAEHKVTVTGSVKKPLVVSGWSVLHLLQAYQIDEEVLCLAKWGISNSKVCDICYQDFFIEPQVERMDENAQRVRAILMSQYMDDDNLKEMLFVDSSKPKVFYSLPTHKGKRLENSLQTEPFAVKTLVLEANRPLGAKVLSDCESDSGSSMPELKELTPTEGVNKESEEKSRLAVGK